METSKLSIQADVLIVGSGIAGLYCALKLAETGRDVWIVTKTTLSENNSRYAQGGIAAVLPTNPEDSLDLHIADTLKAGAGLCDEAAVRSILGEGYEAVADLLLYGVPFDKTTEHELAVTREAAHSVARIIHAGGDATGHSVEATLIERIHSQPNIHTLEHTQIVELQTAPSPLGSQIAGALALDLKQKQVLHFATQQVVLATGGIGQLYRQTTNPVIATGDGLALAQRAGAQLKDLEFVQFHPTAFYAEGRVRFLLSEAMRGEGAILRNHAGEAFAQRYHPQGELAPRDIVTRSLFAEMQATQQPHLWLDVTHLGREHLQKRFPTILAQAKRYGVDATKQPLPVAPAAHYLMGGIQVSVETAESSVKGLFAIGETAATGLHGANRLASNSLLECLVLARRVKRGLEQGEESLAAQAALSINLQTEYRFEPVGEALTHCIEALHHLMWDHVSIVRSPKCLKAAQTQVQQWLAQAQAQQWQTLAGPGGEAVNQLEVALAVINAALARPESIGAHYIQPSSVEPPLPALP